MKRKAMVRRERNGRPQRSEREGQELPAAAEVKRLQAAALTGMRDAVWGTTLGYLHLSGKLTTQQFAAGKMWSDLVAEYSNAMQSPQQPHSANLERAASSAIDPDSDEGRKQARRHAQITQWFTAASAVLAHAGTQHVRAVALVCEQNNMPVGENGLRDLAHGLQVLAVFFSQGARKQH